MEIDDLKEIIEYSSKRLLELPEEDLQIRNRHGKCIYYKRNTQTGKEYYLGVKDIGEIQQLQEKAYLIELKKTAEKEIPYQKKNQQLKEMMPHWEEVFFKMPDVKRNLIKPYVLRRTIEIEKKIQREITFWIKESNHRKGVNREINLTTLNGERVRSKSELIIADRLKNAGVMYYYEARCILYDEKTFEQEVWFPDFCILTKNGDTVYWEHFGIMDNPEYCASCQYKLETYAKFGVIQGKNLIVTMESSKHGLNTDYVDCLINTFLR